jgi:hypothetical protein
VLSARFAEGLSCRCTSGRPAQRSGVLVNGCAVAHKTLENLLGGLVPYERLGFVVPRYRPGADVLGQLLGVAVGGTLQVS